MFGVNCKFICGPEIGLKWASVFIFMQYAAALLRFTQKITSTDVSQGTEVLFNFDLWSNVVEICEAMDRSHGSLYTKWMDILSYQSGWVRFYQSFRKLIDPSGATLPNCLYDLNNIQYCRFKFLWGLMGCTDQRLTNIKRLWVWAAKAQFMKSTSVDTSNLAQRLLDALCHVQIWQVSTQTIVRCEFDIVNDFD